MSLSKIDFVVSENGSSDIQKRYNLCQSFNDLELKLVEQNFRKAGLLKVKKSELDTKKKEFKENGLKFTTLNWVQERDGFNHKNVPVIGAEPDAICLGVVSRKQEDGEALYKAYWQKRADHNKIGSLLGYPECCCIFFDKLWNSEIVDTVWHQALNTEGYKLAYDVEDSEIADIKGYPECVAHLRYWGLKGCFHLPCSYKCEATKKLTQHYLEFFDKADPRLSGYLFEILSLETTWSSLNGHLIVDTPFFKAYSCTDKFASLRSVNFRPIV